MPRVTEKQFTYEFPGTWTAEKFDTTSFYTSHFQKIAGGTRAVDVLAFGTDGELWMIEQKDYRNGSKTNSHELFKAVAQKMLGTMACLVSARSNAQNGSKSHALATNALLKHKIRCVLHIEQPERPSKLFPHVIDPKNVRQELRRALRAVDPHAEGGNKDQINARVVPWKIL